jgi:hypothetical protein
MTGTTVECNTIDNILIIKLVTQFYFILTILTWSLAYIMCKHRINEYTKCWQIKDNFDGHAAGAGGQ